MQNQLKSSLILLDNIFFGKVKFTRNTYAEKLSELGFPNSNTTISKILKYFKENKFEVIISILMIISFFYKIEISIFLFGILLLKKT